MRWPLLSSAIVSLTTAREGNSLPKSLILLILTNRGYRLSFIPLSGAQISAVDGIHRRVWQEPAPKIWLKSLTNKVAIVIDLRAQSTR